MDEKELRDRVLELEAENIRLKRQLETTLEAMARLLKAMPHDPTTEGMLHRDY